MQGHAQRAAASLKPHMPLIGGAALASVIVLLWGGLHRKCVQRPWDTQADHITPLQPSYFSAVIAMEPLAPKTPQAQVQHEPGSVIKPKGLEIK